MNGFKILVWVILTGYFLLIGRILFYQIGPVDRQTFFTERQANVVPFLGICENIGLAREKGGVHISRAFFFIGGNLLLLLPWGFIAPVVLPSLRRVRLMALSGFLISSSAELIQYGFRIGVFETDDILLNTTGTVLGLYLYKKSSTTLREITFSGK